MISDIFNKLNVIFDNILITTAKKITDENNIQMSIIKTSITAVNQKNKP